MSTRGGRQSMRGRPKKQPHDFVEDEVADLDVSVGAMQVAAEEAKTKHPRVPKTKPQDTAVLLRNMDIARSKIGVLIDSLEGDDNEAVLKRNVATAVKHLKVIYDLLEH